MGQRRIRGSGGTSGWHVIIRAGVILLVTVAGRAADGQDSAGQLPASGPATQPVIWLRVVADLVNIRSRPDANSLVVARVPRDTVLKGVERDAYGWYRILPPEEVYSFVAAEYVDRRGPTEGVVSTRSGALRVRVGSLVYEVDPKQSEVQTLLPSGSSVRILGEQGAWLKIAAPPGVFLYVYADHVQPIGDQEAARLRMVTGATIRPGSAPADEAVVAASTRPAPEPDLSGRWGQRLLLVETQIEAEGRRPLVDQSWTEIIGRLKPIASQREEPMVARLADAWIAQLERRMVEQEAVRQAEVAMARAARDQLLYQREMERIERARRPASNPTFDACGRLVENQAGPGPGGQRRYKLLDPHTQQLVAYVEIESDSRIQPEGLINRCVGVIGRRHHEPETNVQMLRADQIIPLDDQVPSTRPARDGN